MHDYWLALDMLEIIHVSVFQLFSTVNGARVLTGDMVIWGYGAWWSGGSKICSAYDSMRQL